MSTSIDQAFIKQFEADVHLAYQQKGTKLRATVRTKTDVTGVSTTFQKVGKGTAATKARHGMVPVMNLDHTPVECALEDFYAGDWVDALDELKTNVDERFVVASAGAYALGRKTDELIVNELGTTASSIVHGSAGLTKDKIMNAVETLNSNDAPDDGQRFGVIGVKQWSDLLNIQEFSSADYVGENYPWLAGSETRKWMGVIWILHNGLPVNTNIRDCFIYHKSAIGHAVGSEVLTDISWHGERAAHFISNRMSQGSCLIEENGVVKIECDETA